MSTHSAAADPRLTGDSLAPTQVKPRDILVVLSTTYHTHFWSAMNSDSTSVAEAQRDMRAAYYGGAPGMLVSALVWFAAGGVAVTSTPARAIVALFVGGMGIHPVGVVLAKALGRTGVHTRGNPLGGLALESTVLLLLGFPLAYVVSQAHGEWFFAAMLLVIGGRYLVFATLYGMRVYWACGALLAVAGFLLVAMHAPFSVGAFVGALIEGAFAVRIFLLIRGAGPV